MIDETSGSLPAGHCETCERLVIAEWSLRDDELESLCIHCEAPLRISQHLSLYEAVEHGYVAPGFEDPHGERGCRDGQCGVQQPDA